MNFSVLGKNPSIFLLIYGMQDSAIHLDTARRKGPVTYKHTLSILDGYYLHKDTISYTKLLESLQDLTIS